MNHDAVRDSHQIVDDAIAFLLENGTGPDGEKVTPTCGKGCPSCCYEPVYAERQEAALLAARLLTLDADVRERVLRRTREWVAAIQQSDLLEQEQPDVIDYRKLRLPCPLLEHAVCLLYEDRPNACRAHIALGPVERCEDSAKRRDQVWVANNDFMAGAVMRLAAGAPGTTSVLLMEHLGLLLAEALLGTKIESEARTMLHIEFEPESADEVID